MKTPISPNNSKINDSAPINGAMYFDLPWKKYFSAMTSFLNGLPASGELLPNYVNDAAAAAGGVVIGGYYRNGSVVMQRVV